MTPDVNLALIRGALWRPPKGIRRVRPQPSFSRLYWHAHALTEAERAIGRRWYADAAADVAFRADEFACPLPVVISAAATLTPGLRWDRTMRVLDLLLSAWRRGEPSYPRTGDATFGFRDREKAWAILRTGDTSLCTGPKVEPFSLALAGDTQAIVVDRHLVRLATGSELRQIHPAAMERIRASVRVIAWALREEPAHIQAALWAAKADSPMTEVPPKLVDSDEHAAA